MTDEQIKHMVDRFLQWKLPQDFSPDCGISFKAEFNEQTEYPSRHEPTGTNLFHAIQAEQMVRFMADGLPNPTPTPKPYNPKTYHLLDAKTMILYNPNLVSRRRRIISV